MTTGMTKSIFLGPLSNIRTKTDLQHPGMYA